MKRAFPCLFLLSAPAYLLAQTTTTPATTQATPQPTAAFSSQKWLESRGPISSDELIGELNAKLSPEQRKQLDEAVARRNSAIQKANDDLTASLRNLLRETDVGLAKRVDETAEAQRMERMKRRQPMRYQQLMAQKKKEKKQATPTPVPTAQ